MNRRTTTCRRFACLYGALPILAATLVAQIPPDGRRPRPILPRHPMVRTESTRVVARIVDGVAETSVTMVFRNEGGMEAEKIIVLPLPLGASADKLEMEVGGKLCSGEVLGKEKAAQIYESIVASRRDPALLEYMGHDTLRLRVFPIPPQGKQEVRVRYRLLMPESGGLHTYDFPARSVEEGTFAFEASIESKTPIKNVWSPLGEMDVSRKDDHHARASLECKGRPQRDPLLFYGLSDRDFGLNLIPWRKQGQDGYFLVLLAPKRDLGQEKELNKSITFVLDTSGSMQGEKIQQAKNALRFFLKSLRPTDRFNVVSFSTEARPFAGEPVPATPEKVDEALKFAETLEARGGTNIEEALGVALRAQPAAGLVPLCVFLTDGLPTVGQTDPKAILAGCEKANSSRTRVFVFGVGDDVNTFLLDKLAADTGGTRDYVRPSENLEVKTSALFEKLAYPVMTDLELVIDKVSVREMVPSRLPDLFRGSRLVIAGRYQGDGHVALRLRGKVAGEAKEFVYEATFPAACSSDHDFVATLWAQRRIAQLLDAIRLSGQNPELVSEIRRLGVEHGIVTPYTSQLIVEEADRVAAFRGISAGPAAAGPGAPAPTADAGERLRRDLERAGVEAKDLRLDDAPAATETAKKAGVGLDHYGRAQSGGKAVEESLVAARLLYLDKLDSKGKRDLWTSQRVGDRTFHLIGGVWIDAGYKREMEKSLRKVRAFSADYFELLRKSPELAKVFAFSTTMVVVIAPDQAVEILPPEPASEEGAK
jgi:Ca-activated chloride channel family protein